MLLRGCSLKFLLIYGMQRGDCGGVWMEVEVVKAWGIKCGGSFLDVNLKFYLKIEKMLKSFS